VPRSDHTARLVHEFRRAESDVDCRSSRLQHAVPEPPPGGGGGRRAHPPARSAPSWRDGLAHARRQELRRRTISCLPGGKAEKSRTPTVIFCLKLDEPCGKRARGRGRRRRSGEPDRLAPHLENPRWIQPINRTRKSIHRNPPAGRPKAPQGFAPDRTHFGRDSTPQCAPAEPRTRPCPRRGAQR